MAIHNDPDPCRAERIGKRVRRELPILIHVKDGWLWRKALCKASKRNRPSKG
jgi:hypothetical protein